MDGFQPIRGLVSGKPETWALEPSGRSYSYQKSVLKNDEIKVMGAQRAIEEAKQPPGNPLWWGGQTLDSQPFFSLLSVKVAKILSLNSRIARGR
jgi:hypothetical protein